MAGGVGSRFWPGSREAKPKQFLDMLGVGKSLLRLTFERFLHLTTADKIYIVTNSMYKSLILEHLPEISENQILCEPSRNNTAPCICWTAFHLHARDSEANFVVAPSDHVVLKEAEFANFLKRALDFSEKNDALLTLGIRPSRPDTGYGYIKKSTAAAEGVFKVERFLEKPDLATAESFVASGEYFWNAGIFIWKAKNLLNAFEKHANNIFQIFKKGEKYFGTSLEQQFIDENYPNSPNISVDYAIAEKAENMFTVPAEFGWSDLGTWASIHAELNHDSDENVVLADKFLLENVKNSLIRMPKEKLLVAKNLDDFMVIDEGDVLLIWPKNEEQKIKNVVAEVKNKFGFLHL
jgi:mannose-1-phosphate guanylyltransferase